LSQRELKPRNRFIFTVLAAAAITSERRATSAIKRPGKDVKPGPRGKIEPE
jgi:hypothetical protein